MPGSRWKEATTVIQVLLGSVASALVLGPLFVLWCLPGGRRNAEVVVGPTRRAARARNGGTG